MAPNRVRYGTLREAFGWEFTALPIEPGTINREDAIRTARDTFPSEEDVPVIASYGRPTAKHQGQRHLSTAAATRLFRALFPIAFASATRHRP